MNANPTQEPDDFEVDSWAIPLNEPMSPEPVILPFPTSHIFEQPDDLFQSKDMPPPNGSVFRLRRDAA